MATDHLRDVDALAAMTRADLEAHAKALRTIHSITEALLSAADLHEALTLAMEAVARLTRFPAVAFFLLNEREQQLELVAARGFAESTEQAARRLPLDGSLSGVAVRRKELVTTDDVSRDERTEPGTRTQLAVEGFTGAACVPLLLGDQVIGAMNLIYKGELGLAPHERRLVEWVGRVVAIGIDRQQARADLEEARQRAQQSERWLGTMLRSIGDAVIATDARGQVMFMNPEAERLTGWPLEAGRGRRVEDVFRVRSERTGAPATAALAEVLARGAPVNVASPSTLLARDATERHIADSIAPIRDETGAVIGEVLVFRDVTEARRAEQWRDFLSQATVALSSSLDYDATLAQVARLAAQSLAEWCVVDLVEPGGSIRRVAGAHTDPAKEPLVDALVRASRIDPGAREGVARVIRTGETVIHGNIRDGQLRPGPRPVVATQDAEHLRLLRELGTRAYMSVPLVARGRVLGAITFATARDPDPFGASDVEGAEMLAVRCALAIDNARLFREAADARSALADEREWLAVTLRSIGDGVIATDDAGRVVHLNSAAERLTGWTEAEAKGRPSAEVLRILEEDTREPVESVVERVLRIGATDQRVEHAILARRDGVELPVEETAAPIRDASGRTRGVVLVLHDVSRRRSAERARQHAEELLGHAQKMEAIGRLAGGIAHDFNNMLAPILAFAALLRRDLEPEDRAYAGLTEIQNAAERAASLTRQLLALSRRQVVAPRELDLNEVVQSIEPMLRRLVGEDVDVSVALAPEPCLVLADPSQMDQVLLNLVVNARDAMPDGGRLTIETANVSIDASRPSPGPEIPPGAYAVLTVSDTGIGMDAATRARLFEPFFTTKAVGAGTGLGLAIVYGIVKQCGGGVLVRAEPGRGARFDVYLPRRTAPAEATRAGALDAATPPRPTETILLVEDDDMARGAARAILVDAGYIVLEARSGGDALLLSERHPGGIDLVLTDVVMPGMSGRDLVERVRASRPDIHVLLMSGYIGDSLRRGEGIEPGTAYVEKPFTPEELTRRVRVALAARPRGGA